MSVRGDTPVTWQRWTIDEIDEGVARIAVAETEFALDPDVAEAYDRGGDAETLRRAIFEVEDAPPEHIWGDETPLFLPITHLTEFLRRRSRIGNLPRSRPLREGDVFWIVLPSDLPDDVLAELETATLPERADKLGIQVWDVTAAARQAAKRTYDQAVRAAVHEEGGNGPST